MQSIPLEQWYCHREKRGLSVVTYFLPVESEQHLSILRQYWDGKLSGLKEVRSHKWGGHVREGHFDEIGSTLFFKRFSIRNPRYIHKPARARATVMQEQRLADSGFTVPKIVALIERRVGGIVVDSAVVSERLVDFIPLYFFLNNGAVRQTKTLQQRRFLAASLGRMVGKLHSRGFFHGDMHSGNIMCRFQESTTDFAWIDNEEGRVYTKVPEAKRLHDLNHLNRSTLDVPLTDRYRFWAGYREENSFSGEERRQLFKALNKLASEYQAKPKRR